MTAGGDRFSPAISSPTDSVTRQTHGAPGAVVPSRASSSGWSTTGTGIGTGALRLRAGLLINGLLFDRVLAALIAWHMGNNACTHLHGLLLNFPCNNGRHGNWQVGSALINRSCPPRRPVDLVRGLALDSQTSREERTVGHQLCDAVFKFLISLIPSFF